MIHFTELENLPTYTANGEYIGRLIDLAINPSKNPLLIETYLVQTPAKKLVCIDRKQISTISVTSSQTSVFMSELRECGVDESFIRIKKDVLDQQIIDVNDQKVVRVGDVDFDIQPGEKNTDLRILAVNVGGAAAIRRLFQGLLAKHRIRQISSIFPPKTIPWEFVSLIEPDPARRVKLRISYNRLAKLHPADLADILEELSRDEQRSVIESLDDETAAEAVSEIRTRMQVALLNSLSAGRAADIVEEMAPDEAADVLQKLSPEASAELLANMEAKEASEVRELLGFEENTAGGLMTTEFAVINDAATVEGAIAVLRDFAGPLETLHAIYLISPGKMLVGVVPLANIALANRDTFLRELAAEQLISVPFYADQREVISMFRKYNLLSLPVVDDNKRLLGIVTADDVLELVVKEN